MNQEIQFAQTLEQVRRMAKEQGNCISEEQVREKFAALDLKEAQLEMVFDYLTKHNIGIGEPLDQDAFLTEEERDYLQMYLDEIEALPAYSDGQREAYAMSVMAGEVTARQQLTESFLREVADIARLYAGQGVVLEDLIGEGNVALAVGVELLAKMGQVGSDAGGEPFIGKPSQAQGMLVKRIMDAMEECIREHAENEKNDQKIADRVNRVADKAGELAKELRRKVTPKELMEETGLSEKAIEEAMRISGFQIEDINVGTGGVDSVGHV